MSDGSSAPHPPPGVPPGVMDAVLAILRAGPVPMRRRKILDALESRGRRLSLAGLNRLLDHATREEVTLEGPDGVRIGPKAPP